MLLIYTHKVTKRFSYIMHHIFGNLLGIEHEFTTKVEDFIKHAGPKITYTKQPLQNEFFIRSNDLLFEQAINDIDLKLSQWEGVPCFFAAGERSNIPFDIFAASFYLLSRYEEYLPHVKDEYGRFPSEESFLFKENIIHRPLVDLWAELFLTALLKAFPEMNRRQRSYRFKPMVKVAVSHRFAHRSFLSNLANVFLDIGSFKLIQLIKRIKVWFNPKRDPYNNFGTLIELHQKSGIKGFFFFQFAEFSEFDKNISIFKRPFQHLIKWVGDYAQVGLNASHEAAFHQGTLKTEKERLSNLVHWAVDNVRLRHNKVTIPDTYRNLVDAEFKNDFSMGYTDAIGFRAGTCTPFYFYDINIEVQQPLKVHPFVLFDHSLKKMKKQHQVFEILDPIYLEIKRLGGTFRVLFSNDLLGSKHRLNWINLYEKLLQRYHV